MLIKLQNVSFEFTPEKQIFKDLTLGLESQKIYALMGANGSGKTTLFNLISGFLKLKNGKIIFKEKDITNKAPYKINREGIGRTFQDLRLIPKLTVKENIILAMTDNPTDDWIKGMMPSSVFKKELTILNVEAEKIIEEYFLADVKNSIANEISYGQQKLLNLACCVANGAELLLLDEPVAGINQEYKKIVSILLQELTLKGKTIFKIEHDTDFISETADSFLFLTEGKISKFDNFDELKNSKETADAYF